MAAPTLALTGATGAVGGLVAAALSDLSPRLVVRDPSRAPDLGGEVMVADYADEGAARRAFSGVDTLLLVSGSESSTRRQEHRTVIGAAADAGVHHVVYTSFAGADAEATFTLGRDHHDAEAAVRETGMAFTFLRDNFYLDLLPWFADDAGVIRGPAGDGRVAGVARADVARVAATVLRDPGGHAGSTYTLTGPEALSLTEVAARAGEVLGRELVFQDETVEEAYASRKAGWPGTDQWQLDAWVSTYVAIADGSVAEVTDDVRQVTGRAPMTLEESLGATA